MWFATDMLDDSSSLWFYWPMFGTGIAVAIAGIVLVGIGALDATLLERFDRPSLVGELYAIRFLPGEKRRSQPHPLGVVEHLHLHAGRARVGPEDAAVDSAPATMRATTALSRTSTWRSAPARPER